METIAVLSDPEARADLAESAEAAQHETSLQRARCKRYWMPASTGTGTISDRSLRRSADAYRT
jgi:hypothetical protein